MEIWPHCSLLEISSVQHYACYLWSHQHIPLTYSEKKFYICFNERVIVLWGADSIITSPLWAVKQCYFHDEHNTKYDGDKNPQLNIVTYQLIYGIKWGRYGQIIEVYRDNIINNSSALTGLKRVSIIRDVITLSICHCLSRASKQFGGD